MKLNFKHKNVVMVIITILLFLMYSGCSNQNPMEAMDSPVDQPADPQPLLGLNHGGINILNDYPQSASMLLDFLSNLNLYAAGTMISQNGTIFQVLLGSLTPPSGIIFGDSVAITMNIDINVNKKEMTFEFGPSGSLFNPGAIATLHWKDLARAVPGSGFRPVKFYYIDDNGTYHEQNPVLVNYLLKIMVVHINHFSRYAIAFSR
jgi:hypothetical protein